jgi:hypothetical protein
MTASNSKQLATSTVQTLCRYFDGANNLNTAGFA